MGNLNGLAKWHITSPNKTWLTRWRWRTCNQVRVKDKSMFAHERFQTSTKLWIIIEKMHRVKIQWRSLANTIHCMNTELWKNAKNDFKKDFFQLMNNAVFGKSMESVRNHGVLRY